MSGTGYPTHRIHYVEGMVEETIPKHTPNQIALLRLDTDWYQSTKHDLIHLYPRVFLRGITIIDDYGHFKGARRAVDEYRSKMHIGFYLHRIDYGARLIIKGDETLETPPESAN